MWTSLEGNQNNGIDNKQKSSLKGRRAKKSKSGKGMGTLDEDNDEEETGGITIKIEQKDKQTKKDAAPKDGTPEEQISLVKNPSDPNV